MTQAPQVMKYCASPATCFCHYGNDIAVFADQKNVTCVVDGVTVFTYHEDVEGVVDGVTMFVL